MQLAHGIHKRNVQRLARCRRIAVISRSQRIDVITLRFADAVFKCQRFLQGPVSFPAIVIRHHDFAIAGHIDVRTERQCLAPVTHGTIRVECLRGSERSRRFCVIEGEIDDQPLIEIALRVRITGGYRVMMISHAREKRRPGPGRQFKGAFLCSHCPRVRRVASGAGGQAGCEASRHQCSQSK